MFRSLLNLDDDSILDCSQESYGSFQESSSSNSSFGWNSSDFDRDNTLNGSNHFQPPFQSWNGNFENQHHGISLVIKNFISQPRPILFFSSIQQLKSPLVITMPSMISPGNHRLEIKQLSILLGNHRLIIKQWSILPGNHLLVINQWSILLGNLLFLIKNPSLIHMMYILI